jgi:hypothetical protein
MSKQDKKKLCIGCRQNFYNGNNDFKIKECWHLKSARVVRRWACGWWTPQDKADGFYPVTILSCRDETGSRAFYKRLPSHLGGAKPPSAAKEKEMDENENHQKTA